MIVGVGTDIIETKRMRDALRRHGAHFLEHVFAPAEIASAPDGAGRDNYFAARWAAKEAVAKALGTGIGADCGWTDIVLHRNDAGKPRVELLGRAAEKARTLGIEQIHVSLSHERNFATAVAVAENKTT